MNIYDSGENMYAKLYVNEIDLHKITEEDIENIIFSEKENEELEYVNITKEQLIDKYIDETGYVYYIINMDLYQLNLKLKTILSEKMKFINKQYYLDA